MIESRTYRVGLEPARHNAAPLNNNVSSGLLSPLAMSEARWVAIGTYIMTTKNLQLQPRR